MSRNDYMNMASYDEAKSLCPYNHAKNEFCSTCMDITRKLEFLNRFREVQSDLIGFKDEINAHRAVIRAVVTVEVRYLDPGDDGGHSLSEQIDIVEQFLEDRGFYVRRIEIA